MYRQRERTNNNSYFVALPYEIHQHILSFIVPTNNNCWKGISDHKECVLTIASFQSLNHKLAEDLKNYLNEFWWNLFVAEFGMNRSLERELNALKQDMINRNVIKRKILLMRLIKFKEINNSSKDVCRMIVMGGGCVGKSALTVQFVQKIFVEDYSPTIEDSYRKKVSLDGVSRVAEVLDTAGQEEYFALVETYIKDGENFIMVCSLDRRNSLKEIRSMVITISRIKESKIYELPFVFVINKTDTHETFKEVTVEECKEFINGIINEYQLKNTSIFDLSAKDKLKTDQVFEECMRMSRYITVEDVKLLQNIIEQDSNILQKVGGKKCSLM